MGLFKGAWKKFSLPGMWSSEKKKQKAGSKKEKKAYKKWLKKYGKDKHVKYDRLSKEQQNLLKTLLLLMAKLIEAERMNGLAFQITKCKIISTSESNEPENFS